MDEKFIKVNPEWMARDWTCHRNLKLVQGSDGSHVLLSIGMQETFEILLVASDDITALKYAFEHNSQAVRLDYDYIISSALAYRTCRDGIE